MSLFKFPSIAHPTKYGYAYDSDAWKGTETNACFRQFETYGDGLLQHSGDWCVTWEYLTDYLQSLAAAMLADETLTSAVSFTVTRHPRADRIAFAATVVWKEESDRNYDKRRFYSMTLQKVGGRTKQHDNRYSELTRYQDGSRASIFRLVTSEHCYGLERFQNYLAVKEWADDQKKYIEVGEGFPEWFDGDNQKVARLSQALRACKYIAEALQFRQNAETVVDCYKHNVSMDAARAAKSETVLDILAS